MLKISAKPLGVDWLSRISSINNAISSFVLISQSPIGMPLKSPQWFLLNSIFLNLSKRKSRVSSNIVKILIPKKEIEILSDIKNLIKCYNYISIFGFYKINNTLYSKREIEISKSLSEKMSNCLKNIGYVIKKKDENV